MQASAALMHQCLDALVPSRSFGIYIHVPFCERRCKYCAFVSSVWRPVPSADYAAALCREMDTRLAAFEQRQLATVYWGGGTPSMLDDHAIAQVLEHISDKCGSAREITLEANPEHVTLERAVTWKSLGFTRISLGVQSFDNAMLAILGRRHDEQRVREALNVLRMAGFEEICIDLIYGARRTDGKSHEEIKRWQQELETARSLMVEHASCYELTLEKHTPLCTAQEHGQNVLCEEDIIADMMAMIPDVLGMQRYEISNYSRNHYFSAHNVSCWAGLPYLGLGPGAHSLILSDAKSSEDAILRRANTGNVRHWLWSMKNGEQPEPEFVESLTAQEHLAERLMCAARTRFWWHPETIAHSIHGNIAPFLPSLDKGLKCGLLEMNAFGKLRTTEQGIALNNRLDTLIFESL